MNIIGKLSQHHRTAIQYFADNLFSKQMQRHVTLHFVFRRQLDCYGITTINDYNDRYLPRDFIIELNRCQSKDEMLKTIAHEMVHVKQYIYKELNDEQNLWHGVRISDNIPYDQQPWELEAEFVALNLYHGLKNILES